VSSLYGPGTVGAWLLTLFSLLVTWFTHPRHRNKDNITVDLIGTLSLPAIASAHLLYILHNFEGSTRDLLTGHNEDALRSAAAIEAPLNVCETFSAFAIPLVAISAWYSNRKRAIITLTLGFWCFLIEILLLIGSSGAASSTVNFTRPFIFNAIGLVVPIFTVAVLLVSVFLATLLISPLRCLVSELEPEMRKDYHDQQRRLQWSSAMTFILAPFTIFASEFNGASGFEKTAILTLDVGNHIGLVYRLLFFIPRSTSSIGDLDRAVAFAVGVVTPGFSIYSTVKTRVAQERTEFQNWKQEWKPMDFYLARKISEQWKNNSRIAEELENLNTPDIRQQVLVELSTLRANDGVAKATSEV
jgi:hypothetical protein